MFVKTLINNKKMRLMVWAEWDRWALSIAVEHEKWDGGTDFELSVGPFTIELRFFW
jgi:hypothetical protein